MYPLLNQSYNITTDLSQLFLYANAVTNNWFVPLIVLAFFLILFIGGSISQQRFTGKIRPEQTFAASSFATLGLSLILATRNGLLSPIYVWLCIIASVVGALWLYFSDEPTY